MGSWFFFGAVAAGIIIKKYPDKFDEQLESFPELTQLHAVGAILVLFGWWSLMFVLGLHLGMMLSTQEGRKQAKVKITEFVNKGPAMLLDSSKPNSQRRRTRSPGPF